MLEDSFLYLSWNDVHQLLQNNEQLILETVKDALYRMNDQEVTQPVKSSLIFDSVHQNRINCMPSFLREEGICGVKWVSVFPTNRDKGLENVEGVVLLSDTSTGKLKCMMNATEVTSMRTAAVGGLAARYLARKDSKSIGFIGCGHEAQAHFQMLKYVMPQIEQCYVSSRSEEGIEHFIKKNKDLYPDVKFINCHNTYESAVRDSDIIITAISSQEPVLKANWIKEGTLYIHVAGLEDEFAVAKKANKIVCDNWESVKHRNQTISQMYQCGELNDNDIYGDLIDIITGEKPGREENDEFIYFNSVGQSVEDIMLCEQLYQKAVNCELGLWINK